MLRTLVRMNVLIMLTLLGLGAGRVDRAVGKGLALLQAGGDRDAVDSAGLLVFLPGGAGDVSANDSLNREDAELAHLHTPVLQHWSQRRGNLGREVEGEEVGAQARNRVRQDFEPCLGAESEQDTLVRDTLYRRQPSVFRKKF